MSVTTLVIVPALSRVFLSAKYTMPGKTKDFFHFSKVESDSSYNNKLYTNVNNTGRRNVVGK